MSSAFKSISIVSPSVPKVINWELLTLNPLAELKVVVVFNTANEPVALITPVECTVTAEPSNFNGFKGFPIAFPPPDEDISKGV